jgi:hypothetical protein
LLCRNPPSTKSFSPSLKSKIVSDLLSLIHTQWKMSHLNKTSQKKNSRKWSAKDMCLFWQVRNRLGLHNSHAKPTLFQSIHKINLKMISINIWKTRNRSHQEIVKSTVNLWLECSENLHWKFLYNDLKDFHKFGINTAQTNQLLHLSLWQKAERKQFIYITSLERHSYQERVKKEDYTLLFGLDLMEDNKWFPKCFWKSSYSAFPS